MKTVKPGDFVIYVRTGAPPHTGWSEDWAAIAGLRLLEVVEVTDAHIENPIPTIRVRGGGTPGINIPVWHFEKIKTKEEKEVDEKTCDV